MTGSGDCVNQIWMWCGDSDSTASASGIVFCTAMCAATTTMDATTSTRHHPTVFILSICDSPPRPLSYETHGCRRPARDTRPPQKPTSAPMYALRPSSAIRWPVNGLNEFKWLT